MCLCPRDFELFRVHVVHDARQINISSTNMCSSSWECGISWSIRLDYFYEKKQISDSSSWNRKHYHIPYENKLCSTHLVYLYDKYNILHYCVNARMTWTQIRWYRISINSAYLFHWEMCGVDRVHYIIFVTSCARRKSTNSGTYSMERTGCAHTWCYTSALSYIMWYHVGVDTNLYQQSSPALEYCFTA